MICCYLIYLNTLYIVLHCTLANCIIMLIVQSDKNLTCRGNCCILQLAICDFQKVHISLRRSSKVKSLLHFMLPYYSNLLGFNWSWVTGNGSPSSDGSGSGLRLINPSNAIMLGHSFLLKVQHFARCFQRRGKCFKVGGANLVLRCDL